MALTRIGASADFAALFARSSYAATSLPLKGDQQRSGKLHVSVVRQYPEAPRIPLPYNVSEIFNIETSRFAPERVRDMTAPIFLLSSKISSSEPASAFSASSVKMRQLDSHVDSYDCFGAISLSGAMQTNVPKPFCSSGKSTFLNMPGGQWARDGKYLAEDLRKSHFNVYKMHHVKRYGALDGIFDSLTIRCYTTASGASGKKTTSSDDKRFQNNPMTRINQEEWLKLSKKERLKIVIRDYGKTVIVFHVCISLISLGIFYALVSSGLDLTEVITFFSTEDSTKPEKNKQLVTSIMSGGSTFLIAYGIHKLFAPLRLSVTLISTPLIVRYLRGKGILKAPKIAATAADTVAIKTK